MSNKFWIGCDISKSTFWIAVAKVDHPGMDWAKLRHHEFGHSEDGVAAFIAWLEGTRNDLEAAAKTVCPVIGDVLRRLEATEGCALARMSGSGGTCFGLFESEADARATARAMPDGWWAEAAEVLA